MPSIARDDDMAYDIPPPGTLPEPGYYYHFKHDPNGPLNNYTYYIYGVGHHTEDDCRAEDAFMQIYRPLYEESYAYRNGASSTCALCTCFLNRPSGREKRCPGSRESSPRTSLLSWKQSSLACTLSPRHFQELTK
jgi:hypothetical protein